jgi:hypothetical protein
VPPLAPLYTGPFQVLERHAKTFRLRVGSKEEVVSVDRLKPHAGTSPVIPASPQLEAGLLPLFVSSLRPPRPQTGGGPLWRCG